jgi:hypothetical protein
MNDFEVTVSSSRPAAQISNESMMIFDNAAQLFLRCFYLPVGITLTEDTENA